MIKDVSVEWGAAVSKSRPDHDRAVAHQAVHALVPQKGLLSFVWGYKVISEPSKDRNIQHTPYVEHI